MIGMMAEPIKLGDVVQASFKNAFPRLEFLMISIDLFATARRSDGEVSTWSNERLNRAVLNYERFLLLVADNPRRPVAPTRDIDEMWHLHMLSPVAYHRDCMARFGELLDHDGGFGKGEGEMEELGRVFEDTADRWWRRFGEPYVSSSDDVTKCWHDCKGRCWHACQSMQSVA